MTKLDPGSGPSKIAKWYRLVKDILRHVLSHCKRIRWRSLGLAKTIWPLNVIEGTTQERWCLHKTLGLNYLAPESGPNEDSAAAILVPLVAHRYSAAQLAGHLSLARLGMDRRTSHSMWCASIIC